MARIISRNLKPSAEWYICGSYVLDVLFGVRVAKDIDVCWLSDREMPSYDDVCAWIDANDLHRCPPNPDFTRVQQLIYPEAGGFASLNIDYWRLERDGHVYAVDPETGEKVPLEAGNTPQLDIVSRPIEPDRASKALQRMDEIRQLNNLTIRGELEQYANVENDKEGIVE
jgi:hypothetical protein